MTDNILPQRPEWVAKISFKHADCLISDVKSKNYPLAAIWLKRAKQVHQLLGNRGTEEVLGETKEQYKRSPALQNQLAPL